MGRLHKSLEYRLRQSDACPSVAVKDARGITIKKVGSRYYRRDPGSVQWKRLKRTQPPQTLKGPFKLVKSIMQFNVAVLLQRNFERVSLRPRGGGFARSVVEKNHLTLSGLGIQMTITARPGEIESKLEYWSQELLRLRGIICTVEKGATDWNE